MKRAGQFSYMTESCGRPSAGLNITTAGNMRIFTQKSCCGPMGVCFVPGSRMGERLGIPVEEKLLIRVKKTNPQKELNDSARRENLKNAFQLCGNDVKLKRVVLIADIYTTGSTLDAAAAALLAAGVEKVYFLSICIGRGF